MKIFVEKLPIDCSYCDVCHTKPYNNRHKIDGEKFCGIENNEIDYLKWNSGQRPNWCPLSKIPKKLSVTPDLDDYDLGYIQGRNECINEMIFE